MDARPYITRCLLDLHWNPCRLLAHRAASDGQPDVDRGGYTHLFAPGNPVYVNSWNSADFKQIERLSTGFFRAFALGLHVRL